MDQAFIAEQIQKTTRLLREHYRKDTIGNRWVNRYGGNRGAECLVRTSLEAHKGLIEEWGGVRKEYVVTKDFDISLDDLVNIWNQAERSQWTVSPGDRHLPSRPYILPDFRVSGLLSGAWQNKAVENDMRGDEDLVVVRRVATRLPSQRVVCSQGEAEACTSCRSIIVSYGHESIQTPQQYADLVQDWASVQMHKPGKVRVLAQKGQSLPKAVMKAINQYFKTHPHAPLQHEIKRVWSSFLGMYGEIASKQTNYTVSLSVAPYAFMKLGHYGENNSCFRFGAGDHYRWSKRILSARPRSYVGFIRKGDNVISRFWGQVGNQEFPYISVTNTYLWPSRKVVPLVRALAEDLFGTPMNPRTTTDRQREEKSVRSTITGHTDDGGSVYVNEKPSLLYPPSQTFRLATKRFSEYLVSQSEALDGLAKEFSFRAREYWEEDCTLCDKRSADLFVCADGCAGRFCREHMSLSTSYPGSESLLCPKCTPYSLKCDQCGVVVGSLDGLNVKHGRPFSTSPACECCNLLCSSCVFRVYDPDSMSYSIEVCQSAFGTCDFCAKHVFKKDVVRCNRTKRRCKFSGHQSCVDRHQTERHRRITTQGGQ